MRKEFCSAFGRFSVGTIGFLCNILRPLPNTATDIRTNEKKPARSFAKSVLLAGVCGSYRNSDVSTAMNPETPEQPPIFWADSSGDVAAVNPADLSAIWKFMREVQAQNREGQCGAIDARSYQKLCSPGANVEAVWFRASMLRMLDRVLPGWMGQADTDKVMAVAASFPMKKMQVGVVYDSPPFDVQEFMKQVANA